MQKGPWMCDTCGQLINRPEDGYVEWLSSIGENGASYGLHIVHHRPASPRKTQMGCQYDERNDPALQLAAVSNVSLGELLGDDGLMDLLHFFAENKLPTEEIVEMIKRIHIANYEQSRPIIARAIANGAFNPNMRDGFFTQNQLENAIQWAKDYLGDEYPFK
ncbi:hypothetical protein LC612_41140 [Nostoc sp. CHAB 5834]|nr:hypothetical protein [Nostoc sp. CHAB 5834]